jgi:hypothetical protein
MEEDPNTYFIRGKGRGDFLDIVVKQDGLVHVSEIS